jgi:hypothetical protein
MSEQIPCPGGCGNQVHRRAVECPQCGYRAEITSFQELLGSLSTISSILIGFGLASLVALATDEGKTASETVVVKLAIGMWTFSSLLLLAVLVMAELVRRQEVGESLIAMTQADQDQLTARCTVLLSAFVFALLLMFVGIVLLGFYFSNVHGVVALIAVLVVVFVVYRVWR